MHLAELRREFGTSQFFTTLEAAVRMYTEAEGPSTIAAFLMGAGDRYGFTVSLVDAFRDYFVDEVVVYLAPALIGDKAHGMFDLPELSELAARRELDEELGLTLGPDAVIVGV